MKKFVVFLALACTLSACGIQKPQKPTPIDSDIRLSVSNKETSESNKSTQEVSTTISESMIGDSLMSLDARYLDPILEETGELIEGRYSFELDSTIRSMKRQYSDEKVDCKQVTIFDASKPKYVARFTPNDSFIELIEVKEQYNKEQAEEEAQYLVKGKKENFKIEVDENGDSSLFDYYLVDYDVENTHYHFKISQNGFRIPVWNETPRS